MTVALVKTGETGWPMLFVSEGFAEETGARLSFCLHFEHMLPWTVHMLPHSAANRALIRQHVVHKASLKLYQNEETFCG